MRLDEKKQSEAAGAQKPELLAPAGSVAGMEAALKAGADAVYIGGRQFGARAYADNPDDDALLLAIDRAHLLGKRLYLTVNTLLKNRETEQALYAWMLPFYRQGLDGVIVQDPGVIRMLRSWFPEMELHASTQMAVTGPAGARLLKEAGVCRVVPARELSLDEIRRIRLETGLEIECFIHGAMCYSYSGMCLMSSLIGGRSGNRGRCAGVCRLPFTAAEGGRTLNGKACGFPLNMKDLCALELLPELIRAGCGSFKIEGRMKRAEYTAGVTEIYRKYIDLWYTGQGASYRVEPADMRRLETLFNRDGLCAGYYQMHNGPEMIAIQNRKQDAQAAKRRSAGVQAEYRQIADRYEAISLKRSCDAELHLETGRPASLTLLVPGAAEVTVRGGIVEAARGQPVSCERIDQQLRKTGESPFDMRQIRIVMPDEPVFIPIGQINALRRRGLDALQESLLAGFHREISGHLHEAKNDFPEVHKGAPAEARSAGRKSPAGQEGSACRLWVQTDRRESVAQMLRAAEETFDADERPGFIIPIDGADPGQIQSLTESGSAVRLAMPYIIRGACGESIRSAVKELCARCRIDGILVRSLEGLGILRDLHMEKMAVLDAGLFAWNDSAVAFYRAFGFTRNTVPLELNQKELAHRDNRGSELILYGRAPMMVSAQCVRKTLGRCLKETGGEAGEMTLTDRRGASFPVVNYCRECYNVIYNSVPTSLIRFWEEAALRTGIRNFRISFTTEREPLMRVVLAACRSGLLTGHAEELPVRTTGGHFRRGVE